MNYTTYSDAVMTSYFLLGLIVWNTLTAGWCISVLLDPYFGGTRLEDIGCLSRFSDYSMGCKPEESQIDSG
jgi:hypothetical protein